MSLSLRNLSVAYGPIVAVAGASLDVEPGRVVAVIGPNGAGKTSLLASVMGLAPGAGSVQLDSSELIGRATHLRSRAGLSYVPSAKGVFTSLSVRETIMAAAGADFDAVWRDICGWFPIIEQKQAALGSDLSGGQQQIVSIARAMATRPRYILMDEPSIGLSPIAVGQLVEAVRVLQQTGVGVLLSEQNAVLALSVSDHIALMVRGEIRLTGTPDELRGRDDIEGLYLGRAPQRPGPPDATKDRHSDPSDIRSLQCQRTHPSTVP